MSSFAINAILRQKKQEEDYNRMKKNQQREKSYKASTIGGVADSDVLYYNVLVHNNETGFDTNGNPTSTNTDMPLVFNETRSQPYVNCAENYYMSIIRFDVDTNLLPLFIPEPKVGAIPVNNTVNTIYSFRISGTGGSGSDINVTWTPADTTLIAPAAVPKNYSDYPFFYAYSYNYFLGLLNTQIRTNYTGSGNACYFTYANGNIQLIGDTSVWQTDSLGNVLGNTYISVNPALYNLISSIPANRNIDGWYQLLFVRSPSALNSIVVNTSLTASAPYNAIITNSEYTPFPIWNPVESISFETTLLPVVPELVAKPVVYGEIIDNSLGVNPAVNIPPPNYGIMGGANIPFFGTPTTYAVSNAKTATILTDFASPLNYGIEYKPNITYQPYAEFRLSDLYDDKPLRDLDIQVYWKDYFGNKHPFLLAPGGSASIKIMFRKKEFNSEY
jgi:hypothetical protein